MHERILNKRISSTLGLLSIQDRNIFTDPSPHVKLTIKEKQVNEIGVWFRTISAYKEVELLWVALTI